MDVLQIRNLNLSFLISGKEYQALHNINLELKKGEMLAIVGESGCGKTISAMSVLQLLPQNAIITSGEIIYNGNNLLKYSDKEMQKIRGKEIALVPQDPMTALNPLLSIGEQISEVIETHQNIKGHEAEKKVIEVLDKVKIPDAKNRLKSYPHEFSGGMRQRVIIAAALACNSEIIIADEPTTALDVTVQAQITDLLKELQKESGTSYIFISHDFGLISEIADDVAVMYAGHVVEKASAKKVLETPLHPYTQALLKALPDFETKELTPIYGQPPSVTDEFKGCFFAPRCEKKKDCCENSEPNISNTDGSSVACFLYK